MTLVGPNGAETSSAQQVPVNSRYDWPGGEGLKGFVLAKTPPAS